MTKQFFTKMIMPLIVFSCIYRIGEAQNCPGNLISNPGIEFPIPTAGVAQPYPIGSWFFPNGYSGLPMQSSTARKNSGSSSFYLNLNAPYAMYQDIDVGSLMQSGATYFDFAYYL